MSQTFIGTCWHCGQDLDQAEYGRETRCRRCDKPTRACRNCRHFAPGRPRDCQESLAEPPLDKERATFCEHFDPGSPSPAGTPRSAAEQLLEQARQLFK